MPKVTYDLSQSGYLCHKCSSRFLSRRPWRKNYCPVCFLERLHSILIPIGWLLIGASIPFLYLQDLPREGLLATGALAATVAIAILILRVRRIFRR